MRSNNIAYFFDITIRFATIDNLLGMYKWDCETFIHRRRTVSNLQCGYLCTSFRTKNITFVPHFYQKALTDRAETFFSKTSDNSGWLFFSIFKILFCWFLADFTKSDPIQKQVFFRVLFVFEFSFLNDRPKRETKKNSHPKLSQVLEKKVSAQSVNVFW